MWYEYIFIYIYGILVVRKERLVIATITGMSLGNIMLKARHKQPHTV